jgi:hypothetical protein
VAPPWIYVGTPLGIVRLRDEPTPTVTPVLNRGVSDNLVVEGNELWYPATDLQGIGRVDDIAACVADPATCPSSRIDYIPMGQDCGSKGGHDCYYGAQAVAIDDTHVYWVDGQLGLFRAPRAPNLGGVQATRVQAAPTVTNRYSSVV